MNQNRRNYYRLLRVQPDASFEVIQSSYRTLLQKLRMHPDLGGDEWNAGLINQAYQTLRNPIKRAEYDKQLLQQYSIKELSEGHIKQNTHSDKDNNETDNKDNKNQRNFYRLLHVQTDSPQAVIEASFSTLIKNTDNPEQQTLLNEAFDVLTNKKEEYDRLLEQCGHAMAVFYLHNPDAEITTNNKDTPALTDLAIYKAEESNAPKNVTPIKETPYQPVITQYCFFCKTPHNISLNAECSLFCQVCDSPLSPPGENFLNLQRRDIERFKMEDTAQIYMDWPGKQQQVTIMDLSPTGLCIKSAYPFEQDSVIKINGSDFRATGKITYSQKLQNEFNNGVQFLTIQFEKQKGHFLSART